MAVRQRVVPQCKYGHGPLGRVDLRGKVPEWAITAVPPPAPGFGFSFYLYVCETCGYSELFDPDPEKTHREDVSK
jgi:hypothetical protein